MYIYYQHLHSAVNLEMTKMFIGVIDSIYTYKERYLINSILEGGKREAGNPAVLEYVESYNKNCNMYSSWYILTVKKVLISIIRIQYC